MLRRRLPFCSREPDFDVKIYFTPIAQWLIGDPKHPRTNFATSNLLHFSAASDALLITL